MKVAVIGGGAAGFFSAIHVKENYPKASVVILERSNKVLSKVRISGGGRCNVTNACTSIPELLKAYPRGGKVLRKAFEHFNTSHTQTWFESRGVPLLAEKDHRMFPSSNTSQSVVDCLMRETKRLRIPIYYKKAVTGIKPVGAKLELTFRNEAESPQLFDNVIVATGGSPSRKGFAWLEDLSHNIEEPVPSLFTFNMPDEAITKLMGVTAKQTCVHIQGTKFRSTGPLLITHWGMSGPAILKLSAFGARYLNEVNYSFSVQVSWSPDPRHDLVFNHLQDISIRHSKKKLASISPLDLPRQLWHFLLNKSCISQDKRWEEAGKKTFNKLASVLTNDIYKVAGKTTFKEEFVTCGGVSAKSIDTKTMQSKVCKNLYFAGEVLDIDAITGGFNFQAAWTTGYIAGKLLP